MPILMGKKMRGHFKGAFMIKSKHFLIDMDGVLVTGRNIIPGADVFLEKLTQHQRKYLILTNNALYSPRDLSHRLQLIGLNIPQERIFTSAMATARFLQTQHPNGTAFVLGEAGLTQALHEVGYVMTDVNPDYVVLGELNHLNLDQITHAIRLIMDGALFIATNPDPNGPGEGGIVPACGALAALIEKASGKGPLFIGKPNPLMMRSALNFLGVHSYETVMVGDRMNTDIIAGISSGLETILVLTGTTGVDDIDLYPYRPSHVFNSVADIPIVDD
jgi:NagD protein